MSRVLTFVLLMSVALCCAAASATAATATAPPQLPKSFIWGVSSSAFQSEGHTTGANWNTYIARDARSGVANPKEAYKNSVDFYTHYRADVGLAAGLGVDTYRISINWTRVEPRPGVFSAKGLDFYVNVVKAMRAKGIEPLITLNHWDYPQWVLDQGGWTNTRTVDDFAAMTQKVVDRVGRQVHLWLTFNEEFFYEFVEQGNNDLNPVQVQQVRSNLIAAHDRAYDIIHESVPGAKVSSNYAWPGNGALASFATDPFTNAVARKLDYLALDYYYPAYDQAATLVNISAGTSYNIALDPFGIFTALRQMHARYPGKPILITENGMPTRNGTRADGVSRQRALTDTVYWVQRARAAGVPVFGYMYWGLTDSYEWGSYTPRFGLYRVDVDKDPTLKRRPTAAVATFRSIVRDRGVPRGYRLSLRPKASNCETTAVADADKATCRAAAAGGASAARASAAATKPSWITAWMSAPQEPGAFAPLIPHSAGTGGRTVRDVVRVEAAGATIRIRLSNVYGSRRLTFGDVRVGLAGTGAAVRPGTTRRVRFGGRASVTIAKGGTALSDPVARSVAYGQKLAISAFSAGATGTATTSGSLLHPSYVSRPGDAAAAESARAFPETVPNWFYAAAVEVRAGRAGGAIAAFGASGTAGQGATVGAARSWPDVLADRLHAAAPGRARPVLNAGISGNTLHESSPCFGERGIARLDRDALDLRGVKVVVLELGGNDIVQPRQEHVGTTAVCDIRSVPTTPRMEQLYRQVVARAHARGIRVIGGTISPFGGARGSTPAAEAQRVELNAWILGSGTFDAVVDVARVLGDPADPTRLNPAYDSGDHLHPNDAGYRALGGAIPLAQVSR